MKKRMSFNKCKILNVTFIAIGLLMFIALIPSEAFSVTITGDDLKIKIAPHSQYYLDHSRTATFEEILQNNAGFRQYKEKTYQFGFTRTAIWIRIKINKANSLSAHSYCETRLVIDNPALGSISLFVPIMHNGTRKVETFYGGWMNPEGSLDDSFLYTTFRFPENYDDTRPLYIRIETPYANQFGITLYSEDAFMSMGFLLMIVIGVCLGILLSMFFYNMVIYFFIREEQYLYYILHVLAQLVYQSVLFGFMRYINYSLGSFLLSHVLFFSSFALAFALLFAKSFLSTKKTARLHDIFIKILIVAIIVIFIINALEFRWISNILSYLLTQLTVIVCISAGIASFRFGFKPALFYLVAILVLASSSVIFMLRIVYVVPVNVVTQHAIFFGTAIESIFLSFALAFRIRLMREKEKDLTEMSITDDLTGLFNKRYFNNVFQSELRESEINNNLLSLLIIDVDHFKHYNDSYGHHEGDFVLRELGAVIKDTIRGDDTPCRYGGEEFSIILPDSDNKAAVFVAERIRSRFMKKKFTPGRGLPPVTVTVSIGVATWNGKEKPDDFFIRCDRALYTAKETGRNRVVTAED